MQPGLSTISRQIVELLAEHSPEYGARLKQRLNVELLKQGLARFNEKDYGFSRFKDFLQKSLSAEVAIDLPANVGDIQVRLKSKPIAVATSSVESLHIAERSDVPVIRSDIWQAFLQPDETRKRYFNKSNDKLIHFGLDQERILAETIAKDAQNFVEIHPLAPAMQLEWMRSFLQDAPLPTNEKHSIETLLNGPYSSAMNATFTRALGDFGTAWRNFRTRLIHEQIFEWSLTHGIPNDRLYATRTTASVGVAHAQHGGSGAREQAIKILEMISEDDIAKIVMPLLVTTIYIKARLS